MSRFRHLQIALGLVLVVILAGTAGYMLIEGWSFLDAVYMTVLTIATVGFREVRQLSVGGRIFTMFLIFAGVGAGGYAVGSLIEVMLEGYFGDIIGGRRMKRRIAELKGHYIICGFGRVGQQVAREFKRVRAPFVVLDSNPQVKERLDMEQALYIQGDASNEEVLKEAGIEQAKGLVTAVDSDADNVYVTLTARVLRPDLFIIARANLEGSEEKLKRAGADRVISPYSIGGRRMASLLLKPVVSDFMDTVVRGGELEFQLEEVDVQETSPLTGLTVKEANIRGECGALILSIRRKSGVFETEVGPGTGIQAGDKLVVIGTKDQLEKLERMV